MYRRQGFSHPCIDFDDRMLQVFDELQMRLEQRLVMRPDPSAKRFDQFGLFPLRLT
jgi:hypothetical protein